MDTCLWKLLSKIYVLQVVQKWVSILSLDVYHYVKLMISTSLEPFHSFISRGEYRDITWATFSPAWKFGRDDITSRCFLIFHLFKGLFIRELEGSKFGSIMVLWGRMLKTSSPAASPLWQSNEGSNTYNGSPLSILFSFIIIYT